MSSYDSCLVSVSCYINTLALILFVPSQYLLSLSSLLHTCHISVCMLHFQLLCMLIHVPIFLSLFLRLSFKLLSAFQFLADFFCSFTYCHSFTNYLTLLFSFSLSLSYSLSLSLSLSLCLILSLSVYLSYSLSLPPSYSLSLSLFLSISISLSLPHIFSVFLFRLALMALHVAKEVKEAEFSTIYKVLG